MNRQHLSEEEISAILKAKFDISPLVQVFHDKDTGIVRYEIEHVPASRRMSIGGLKRYCRRICDSLDADIGGTVNIEFISLGDDWTFDILAEARQNTSDHHQHAVAQDPLVPPTNRDSKKSVSSAPLSDEEFRAVDNLNESVVNLYEHAAARNLDTLSSELADMIEDAWKFLQPVKRLGLVGRMSDTAFRNEKERRLK